MKPETRGGPRKGTGPKLMYGEQTTRVMFNIPTSKVDMIKEVVKEKLKKFKTVQ